jgi:hypothetical protein
MINTEYCLTDPTYIMLYITRQPRMRSKQETLDALPFLLSYYYIIISPSIDN